MKWSKLPPTTAEVIARARAAAIGGGNEVYIWAKQEPDDFGIFGRMYVVETIRVWDGVVEVHEEDPPSWLPASEYGEEFGVEWGTWVLTPDEQEALLSRVEAMGTIVRMAREIAEQVDEEGRIESNTRGMFLGLAEAVRSLDAGRH